jgi:alpha-D-ribose 1-methylphosphonate 5-triphosphate synthase subunit PhnL
MIEVRGLGKMFTLHNQGGMRLPVLESVDFDAAAGDCLVLAGPSGTGTTNGWSWPAPPNNAFWPCGAR